MSRFHLSDTNCLPQFIFGLDILLQQTINLRGSSQGDPSKQTPSRLTEISQCPHREVKCLLVKTAGMTSFNRKNNCEGWWWKHDAEGLFYNENHDNIFWGKPYCLSHTCTSQQQFVRTLASF